MSGWGVSLAYRYRQKNPWETPETMAVIRDKPRPIGPPNAWQGLNQPSGIETDDRENKRPWFSDGDDGAWPADSGSAYAFRDREKSESTIAKREQFEIQQYLLRQAHERSEKQRRISEWQKWLAAQAGRLPAAPPPVAPGLLPPPPPLPPRREGEFGFEGFEEERAQREAVEEERRRALEEFQEAEREAREREAGGAESRIRSMETSY